MPKTAFVRDEIFHKHNKDERWHPENPGRLEAIERYFDRTNWQGEPPIEIPPRAATEEEILLNHTAEHLERIKMTANRTSTVLDPDTSASAETYEASLKAAGALLTLADKILAGEIDNGFAAVRPPGHHATSTRSMGFCIFNNVAIAARYLLKKHKLNRIAIVDFDVHHGNGTQDSFYSDPQVLYISSHRYPFYPGTGWFDETGVGEGKGYTINLPLPAPMGDSEYVFLYDRFVAPIIETYKPDFLIVSAGYDAHKNDPLGGMRVSEDGYVAIVHTLLEALNSGAGHGRVILALEGGYDFTALAKSVIATIKVLRGELDARAVKQSILAKPRVPTLDEVIEHLKKELSKYQQWITLG